MVHVECDFKIKFPRNYKGLSEMRSFPSKEGGSDTKLGVGCVSHFRSDPCMEGDLVLFANCYLIWTTEGCEPNFIDDGCDSLRLVAIDHTRLYSLDVFLFKVVRIHLWIIVKENQDTNGSLDANGMIRCEEDAKATSRLRS